MKNKNSLKSDAKITVNPHLHDFWFPQRYLDNSITGADFQSKSLRYRMDSRGKNYRKTLVMTESPIVLIENESFLGINTLPTENCLTSESLSIKTIIDKQEISKNLNQRSLELSVKLGDSYKSDKDIKRITQNNIKKQSNHNRKTQKRNSIALYRTTQRIFPKKRVKSIPVDTSLNVKEVKMIMDELKSINQSEEWNIILKTFKNKPNLLLDLIPIKQVKTRLSLSPNEARYRATTASITPPKNQALERPGTQLRMRTPIVYHRSNKPRNLRKRRASTMSTEDHENSETVESLLEKTSENLTDDWARSLLNYQIKNKVTRGSLSENTILDILKSIPDDQIELRIIHQKGMTTLEKLLIELLGTQEDVKNFKQRFNSITPSSIQILLSKCLEIFQVRNMTIEILKEIHNRETLIRRLKLLRPEDLKPKVIEIIKLSKILRKKIHDWLDNKLTPFSSFVYRSRDYLAKISQDILKLQSLITPNIVI